MSYPPSGGYPGYPPANYAPEGPSVGFGAAPKPPQAPGGYPPLPGGSPYQTNPGYPAPGQSYGGPTAPSYPPQPGASPYGSGGPSPYPPMGSGSGPPGGPSPYAPSGQPGVPSPYSTPGASSYPPPSGASSPYAPQVGSPYGPPGGHSTYAQPSSGYPGGSGASPYPTPGGGFPMPGSGPQGGYPPQPPGAYPPSTHSAPYGQQPGHYPNPSAGPANYHGSILNPYKLRPTVRHAMSFDPSSDASALRKAMKGLGTDEKAIIQVLARRTEPQRQQILLKYQQAYGRDLVKDLKKELSGDFENVILSLMTPLAVFLAKELNRSMMGIGTKERVLIEVLCTRDNNSIRSIKAAYYDLYHAQLDQHIKDDTSGNFKRIMVSMSTGQRDEHNMDSSLAPSLAQSLYRAGEGKWGTEESEFRRILATYSYPVLRCVFEEYKKIKGHTFAEAIKSELSGDFRDAMLAIYHSIQNQAAFFASQLRNAMEGMGTKDATLIRIVTSRCEIDMGNIKDEYKKAYGKRLEDAISSETSGDYKKVLLALIQD